MKNKIDPYFIVVTLVMTWQIRIDDMADDMENRLVSCQTNIYLSLNKSVLMYNVSQPKHEYYFSN